jgi:hypothetical protein
MRRGVAQRSRRAGCFRTIQARGRQHKVVMSGGDECDWLLGSHKYCLGVGEKRPSPGQPLGVRICRARAGAVREVASFPYNGIFLFLELDLSIVILHLNLTFARRSIYGNGNCDCNSVGGWRRHLLILLPKSHGHQEVLLMRADMLVRRFGVFV